MDVDGLLRPWLDRLLADVGPMAFFDAHTHIGRNDPDGFRQEPEELLAVLEPAGARALVFPMHEPGGYREPNDVALAAAAASEGRLQAFCRVDPADDAVAEAARALDAGAVGIKLHPRAEQFSMHHEAVPGIVALAHERRVPILIHAGRGIPALGEDTIRLSGEYPGARLILAHCAVSDIAWIWRELPAHPNVFIDTSWWNPADMLAVLRLAPPGQVLWASDSPYGLPVMSIVDTFRTAQQAGWSAAQMRGLAGAQLERLIAGEEPLDLGPAVGSADALHPLVERLGHHLVSALARMFVGAEFAEPVGLARLACAVGEDGPHADLFAAVLGLLDLFERELRPPEEGRPIPAAARLLVHALFVSRTPDVPIPPEALSTRPERDSAEPG